MQTFSMNPLTFVQTFSMNPLVIGRLQDLDVLYSPNLSVGGGSLCDD